MHIETTRCVCDECGSLKTDSIILTTTNGSCSFQLCNLCAKRVLFLLKSEVEDESSNVNSLPKAIETNEQPRR